MEHKLKGFLETTIHDSNHLRTVYERLDYILFLKEAIGNNNPKEAKEALAHFYEFIAYDHQNYVPPDDLLAAAIGRTQFFHGMIYSTLLDQLAPSVFAYSLSLVHIEMINRMKKPDEAFAVTCTMIDTYCGYIQSLKRIKTSDFSAKVMTLIDLNIKNALTTRILADHLHLNPDYLQKNSKQKPGGTSLISLTNAGWN